MPSHESDTYTRLEELRTRQRVELRCAPRCWDVTACCGPEGDEIMVDTYLDRGAAFLKPDEAMRIARALQHAARVTERDAGEVHELLVAQRGGVAPPYSVIPGFWTEEDVRPLIAQRDRLCEFARLVADVAEEGSAYHRKAKEALAEAEAIALSAIPNVEADDV